MIDMSTDRPVNPDDSDSDATTNSDSQTPAADDATTSVVGSIRGIQQMRNLRPSGEARPTAASLLRARLRGGASAESKRGRASSVSEVEQKIFALSLQHAAAASPSPSKSKSQSREEMERSIVEVVSRPPRSQYGMSLL